MNVELLRPGLNAVPSNNYEDQNALRVTIDQGAKPGDKFEALIYVKVPGEVTILPFAAAASGTFEAIPEFPTGTGRPKTRPDRRASGTFEAIPEFPTVALPIAAILGLAFFMQRRKEE